MPTADVLPSGVRRRWSRRDAWLPAVLTAELLAGMVCGAAYERRDDVLRALSFPTGPVQPGPAAPVTAATTTVVVPPPPAPPVPPPPPLRTLPHNPFAVLVP